jgi:hypothetical protein
VLRGEILRCSCCHRDTASEVSLTIGGSTVFCELCRPSDEIIADPDELAALVDELHGRNRPRCPHRGVIGQE